MHARVMPVAAYERPPGKVPYYHPDDPRAGTVPEELFGCGCYFDDEACEGWKAGPELENAGGSIESGRAEYVGWHYSVVECPVWYKV
jgi:hypothetical protein